MLATQYFAELTRNAAKLIRATDAEMVAQGIAEKAASLVYGDAKKLLLEMLNASIEKVPEYNYPAFSGPLRRCFRKHGIITFSRRGVFVNAMALVGDWDDLQTGISYARTELHLGKLDPERAAAFWHHRIYAPARENIIPRGKGHFSRPKRTEKSKVFDYIKYAISRYKRTIEARKTGWKGLAPYWLWLENGNKQGTGIPYPKNGPTRFVYNSTVAINEMYQATIIRVIEKYTGQLSDEVVEFLYDPSIAQPGEGLGGLQVGADIKSLFVTPTGFLGYRTIRG